MNNVGLVLSGGGFRGIAHIGVIKLLEELDITPTHVSGTSAGALVAAFYAAGYQSNEILHFFVNTKIFSWRNYAFRKAGMLDPMKFIAVLKAYFPDNRFEVLQKRLFIARTNLGNGTNEIVSKGPLIPNILASAALPLMFAPVEIDDTLYADGGITNNFPAKAIRSHCKHLIGVYVNPLVVKSKQEFKSSLSVMERALHISIAQTSIPKFDLCEVMIVPKELTAHSLLDLTHANEIFEIGYHSALAYKNQLQQMSNKGCYSKKTNVT